MYFVFKHNVFLSLALSLSLARFMSLSFASLCLWDVLRSRTIQQRQRHIQFVSHFPTKASIATSRPLRVYCFAYLLHYWWCAFVCVRATSSLLLRPTFLLHSVFFVAAQNWWRKKTERKIKMERRNIIEKKEGRRTANILTLDSGFGWWICISAYLVAFYALPCSIFEREKKTQRI